MLFDYYTFLYKELRQYLQGGVVLRTSYYYSANTDTLTHAHSVFTLDQYLPAQVGKQERMHETEHMAKVTKNIFTCIGVFT